MSDFLDIAKPDQKNIDEHRRLLSLYSVFETDVRARELLALWTDQIEAQDVPPDSSIAKYAYYEARRAFVRGIHRQIKLAKTV